MRTMRQRPPSVRPPQTKKITDVTAPIPTSASAVPPRSRYRWLHAQRIWLVAGGVVIVALVCASAVVMLRKQVATPEHDAAGIQQAVARHMLLPADEQPALATVTDAHKLNTPFLKQAHNGDKILIYQKNQMAIIYRPDVDRIVAVGPVSIDSPPVPAGGNTTAP